MITSRRSPLLCRYLWLLLLVAAAAPPRQAQAQGENRLLRVKMLQRPAYTRVTLFFLEPPSYRLSRFPGGVRLTFKGADAPPFKRLRAWPDPHFSGVRCSQHGGDLQVVIPVKGGSEVRPLDCGALSLSLDIGVPSGPLPQPEIVPGREAILAGTEKFVREYTPASHAVLPFMPSDPKLLHKLFSQDEVAAFQVGEGLLYREKGTEALEAFAPFLAKGGAAKALAAFRTGEALYLMERYDAALKSFRQGDLLWPEFLGGAPYVAEQYADALARGGEYLAGRRLMGSLIAAYSGDSYQPPLINRLAEMTARHGETEVALHLYRLVAERFPGNVAAARARMKLADREMFSVPRDGVGPLLAKYRAIASEGASLPLRDEALFKTALLQALYGTHEDALEQSANYERLYPRGIFVTIVRKMREELVYVAYRDLLHDLLQDGGRSAREGLVRLATENREYLARSFADPGFAPKVSQAFHESGQLTRELELFGFLAERSFVGGAAPLLAQHLVEDGFTLGKLAVAEESGRSFLARFPRHEGAGRVRELLGRISFDRGDLKETASRLLFLCAKGAPRPHFAESDYYLGKALLAAQDHRGADRSLARFAAAAPPASPLLSDALFGRVQALDALGDRRGALELCRQGAKGASGETADHFLYRMGELHLQLKEMREAAAAWDKVAKEGREGVWRTMARESLSDLQWRLKMSRELPSPSKR